MYLKVYDLDYQAILRQDQICEGYKGRTARTALDFIRSRNRIEHCHHQGKNSVLKRPIWAEWLVGRVLLPEQT